MSDRELLEKILDSQTVTADRIERIERDLADFTVNAAAAMAEGFEQLRKIGPGLDRFFDSIIGRSIISMVNSFGGKTNV